MTNKCQISNDKQSLTCHCERLKGAWQSLLLRCYEIASSVVNLLAMTCFLCLFFLCAFVIYLSYLGFLCALCGEF